MKKTKFPKLIIAMVIFTILSANMISCQGNAALENAGLTQFNRTREQNGSGSTASITDDGSTTNYTDKTSIPANAVISEDLYENFIADASVEINFNESSWTVNVNGISGSEVSIKETDNSESDESSKGLEIQYKGRGWKMWGYLMLAARLLCSFLPKVHGLFPRGGLLPGLSALRLGHSSLEDSPQF